MENDKLKKFIKTTIREYLNENVNNKIIGDKTTAILKSKKNSRLGIDYYYDVYDDVDNVIGYIEITDRENGHKPIPYYQSGNVELHRKGVGYGTSLYISLINSLEKPLVSDPGLSDEAKGLWDKLVNMGYATKWIDDMSRERFISIKKRG